ncbi:hypothetical protein LJB89_01070, partial [Tyzzerella sp. OttesenSCG-928-J15]|nr:hypothetical protein [Tyzzerella sp. OttesenSCG-928-J15]
LNSMKAFNVITINDFDTSSLTNMSKDAIKSWVSAGGILIIGSGENYQKTLKGLGDIIQIEKSESVVSDDLDLLLEEFDEEVYGEETPQLSAEEKQEDKQEETGETEEKKEVGEVNPLSAEKKAAKPIVLELISLGERGNEIKTSLYSSISYGGGKIIIFPFDLGNSAVSKSLRLVDFINTVILAEVNSNAASNNMHNRSGSYVVSPYELRNIPLQNIGTTSLIFAIIIIYIVIAGPVLYIILKKKDRREEGFVVIPCLAIGITLLIFVMSFNTVYKKPIINEVSVINAYPGQRQAVKTSNYAVMTGKKGDISVEINNGDFTPNPFVEDGYYGYYSYGDGKNIKVIYGDKPGLKYYANERWDTNIFGNSSEVDLGGNVDVDMFLEDGVYKGVIKNNTNYDLKDMVISFGMRSFVNFGNLEKGGELIIDDALKDKSKVKTDIYSILWDDDGGYQARQKGNEVEDWKKSMYRSILDTNANSNIYSYYTSSYYGGYSGYNKISAKGITIYAYIDEALNEIDVSVAGAEPVKYSNNMLKLSAECQMVFNEKYTLPYGVIDIDEIISSGPYDYDYSYGIYCYSTNELQFVFDLSEYSDDILSFMFSADFRANTYGATINAQIYNCTEDTWNQLTYATYSNPHDYMDSDGKVKLKVDTTNLEHVNIPEISLKGAK